MEITNDIASFGSHELKVKMEIPAGIFYNVDETVTGTVGAVDSLIKVNPVITCIPNSSQITIVEENSGQKFIAQYGDDWINKTVEIDCENRVVYLKQNSDDDNPLDISVAADWNVDWFILQPGEFKFIETNCIIQRISYRGS